MDKIQYDESEYAGETAILKRNGIQVDSIYIPDLVEKYIKDMTDEIGYKKIKKY